MIVSAPEPPRRLSTFETVAVLAAVLSDRLSVPAPRSMEALASCGGEGDGVVARAADQGLDVGQRAGVEEVAERQLVGAGAQIDAVGGQ